MGDTPDDLNKFAELVNILSSIVNPTSVLSTIPTDMSTVQSHRALLSRIRTLSRGYFGKDTNLLHQAATNIARNTVYKNKTRKITDALKKLCEDVKICGSCHTGHCVLQMMDKEITQRLATLEQNRKTYEYGLHKQGLLDDQRARRLRNPIGT
jgi:hypothetical protein